MAFTDTQIRLLAGKLPEKHIRTREERGLTLSYIEGWHVIDEANRVFGFDAWDRETIWAECVWADGRREPKACAYAVRVRIRVRAGERVMFHFLNASAIEIRHLALPGHKFNIVALDGNPVPQSAAVDVLMLGPGERIDAWVAMNHPGVWVMGAPEDMVRDGGLGVVIEYANQRRSPQWMPPPSKSTRARAQGRRKREAPTCTLRSPNRCIAPATT